MKSTQQVYSAVVLLDCSTICMYLCDKKHRILCRMGVIVDERSGSSRILTPLRRFFQSGDERYHLVAVFSAGYTGTFARFARDSS